MHSTDFWGRILTAMILAVLSVLQIVIPDRFTRGGAFCRPVFGKLTLEQSERLRRVLEARDDAEGASILTYASFALLMVANVVVMRRFRLKFGNGMAV